MRDMSSDVSLFKCERRKEVYMMAWIINEETKMKWEVVDEELLTRLLETDHYTLVKEQQPLKKTNKATEKEK